MSDEMKRQARCNEWWDEGARRRAKHEDTGVNSREWNRMWKTDGNVMENFAKVSYGEWLSKRGKMDGKWKKFCRKNAAEKISANTENKFVTKNSNFNRKLINPKILPNCDLRICGTEKLLAKFWEIAGKIKGMNELSSFEKLREKMLNNGKIIEKVE